MTTVRLDPRPVRVPVRVLATSNLTLSGLQTVTGVLLHEGDLVGCLGQSDNVNAIYVAQDGAWLVVDPAYGTGLEVYAVAGTNANKLYGCDTTGAITWGTTTTTFTLKSSSGAAFNPAAPGPLGETTASTLRTTTLTINGGTTPTAAANTIKLWATADASTLAANFGVLGLFSQQNLSSNAGAHTQFACGTVSLADDATLDIPITAGGHGTVTAIGASSSVSGSFSFGANGATTTNGLTYSSFDTNDTDTKLCAYTGGAATLRIKNRLGSTQKILITLWMGIQAS